MSPRLFLLAGVFFASLLRAEITPAQQEIIEELLELREEKAFKEACEKAAALGVPRQAILEAQFLYLVDQADRAELAAFSDTLAAAQKDFEIDNSLIFSVPEDFAAIVEYTRALAALERADQAAFKKHITEAFWLSPKQSQIFGQHIEKLRRDEYMAGLRLDLQRPYPFLTQAEKSTSLAQVLGEAPILILHFWSPWSPESEATLPDFRLTCQALAKHRLPVASILAHGNPDSENDARLFAKGQAMNIPCTWLLDHPEKSLTNELRVQTIPTFAIVSREGRILFHGTPNEADFWEEIKKHAPTFQRPDSFQRPPSFGD
ncbi:MAG: TlpA family protein disulfide reductase [Verrucomicrobiales bacterium]